MSGRFDPMGGFVRQVGNGGSAGGLGGAAGGAGADVNRGIDRSSLPGGATTKGMANSSQTSYAGMRGDMLKLQPHERLRSTRIIRDDNSFDDDAKELKSKVFWRIMGWVIGIAFLAGYVIMQSQESAPSNSGKTVKFKYGTDRSGGVMPRMRD